MTNVKYGKRDLAEANVKSSANPEGRGGLRCRGLLCEPISTNAHFEGGGREEERRPRGAWWVALPGLLCGPISTIGHFREIEGGEGRGGGSC